MNAYDLAGKTAIITGGAGGIGRAIARLMLESGAAVSLWDRSRQELEDAARDLTSSATRRVRTRNVDITRVDAIAAAAAADCAEFGRVDILVNNAGMGPRMPSHEVTEQLFDSVVNLNFKGPFRLASQIGKRMFDGDGGCIINVSSSGALMPLPGVVPYGSSKAALNAMSVSLAWEYAPKVRVNTLSPGAFTTDISKGWSEGGKVKLPTPRGFPGAPEEIVTAALFLASSASVNVTASLVRCDGGQH